MAKILFIGETWVKHILHQKGFDSFSSTHYEFGASRLFEVLNTHEITHIPAHAVEIMFPKSLEDLKEFDVVFISDVGSNSFLIPNKVFNNGETIQNPLSMIVEYVEDGGSLAMMGGYMSFSGIDAKARYGQTVLDKVLPVECLNVDDRVETPEGIHPEVVKPSHALFNQISGPWPTFLGYNRTVAKAEAEVLATIGESPFVVVAPYKKGKSLAFTSDCSPHWGSQEFLDWYGYAVFWNNVIEFLSS
jgi:uncharacterized membrane protein